MKDFAVYVVIGLAIAFVPFLFVYLLVNFATLGFYWNPADWTAHARQAVALAFGVWCAIVFWAGFAFP